MGKIKLHQAFVSFCYLPLRMICKSKKAGRTSNPIRNIVDNLKVSSNHPKTHLNLALGDPTGHKNLRCPSTLTETIKSSLDKADANGYLPSVGAPAAREAIADYTSTQFYKVRTEDVVIASGCSGSIDLALSAILDEGDNVLIPRPGFPLYQVITESLGGSVKQYNLLADKGWECDLEHMSRLVDARTKAIIVSNPSNPCGSCYSAAHLEAIAAVARMHSLPIIADEIYAGCVFDGQFNPMHLHSGDVPVISLGGLAKEFLVPGWRVGWLILLDRGSGVLDDLRQGVKSLSQLVLGANSLIQAAIPRLLAAAKQYRDNLSRKNTTHRQVNSSLERDVMVLDRFFADYMDTLRDNVAICQSVLQDCPELSMKVPKGAMYAMVQIDLTQFDPSLGLKDDGDFARLLLAEENLFVLPGKCFSAQGDFIRLVICPPSDLFREACERLKAFCTRHSKEEIGVDKETVLLQLRNSLSQNSVRSISRVSPLASSSSEESFKSTLSGSTHNFLNSRKRSVESFEVAGGEVNLKRIRNRFEQDRYEPLAAVDLKVSSNASRSILTSDFRGGE